MKKYKTLAGYIAILATLTILTFSTLIEFFNMVFTTPTTITEYIAVSNSRVYLGIKLVILLYICYRVELYIADEYNKLTRPKYLDKVKTNIELNIEDSNRTEAFKPDEPKDIDLSDFKLSTFVSVDTADVISYLEEIGSTYPQELIVDLHHTGHQGIFNMWFNGLGIQGNQLLSVYKYVRHNPERLALLKEYLPCFPMFIKEYYGKDFDYKLSTV